MRSGPHDIAAYLAKEEERKSLLDKGLLFIKPDDFFYRHGNLVYLDAIGEVIGRAEMQKIIAIEQAEAGARAVPNLLHLMRILNRPIIVISSGQTVKNFGEGYALTGEPIFLYCHENRDAHGQLDKRMPYQFYGLRVVEGHDAREVLSHLHSPTKTISRAPEKKEQREQKEGKLKPEDYPHPDRRPKAEKKFSRWQDVAMPRYLKNTDKYQNELIQFYALFGKLDERLNLTLSERAKPILEKLNEKEREILGQHIQAITTDPDALAEIMQIQAEQDEREGERDKEGSSGVTHKSAHK